ncbi:MAG: S8 family serine peptidase [Chloroflexota bacterium]
MGKRKFIVNLCEILICLLLFGLLPLPSAVKANAPLQLPTTAATTDLSPVLSPAIASTTARKVIVDNSDSATLAEMAKVGATLLVDYNSFSLWQVTSNQNTRLLASGKSLPTAQPTDNLNLIELRENRISTDSTTPQAPTGLSQAKTTDAQFWMVQFIGPVKEAWLKNLQQMGIEPVIYMPTNAYVVWLNGASLTQLENLPNIDKTVQWTGAYHPAYRLSPVFQPGKNRTLPASSDLVSVTVQLYTTPNTATTLSNLQTLGGKVLRNPSEVLNFTDISLELPFGQLTTIANWADVFNVEPWSPPIKLDEAQGQILAGNLTNSGGKFVPTGPGYLNWLSSKGFPTDPAAYPVVDIVDDGLDNGSTTPLHPDFYQQGLTSNSSRLVFNTNCTNDTLPNGTAGHGNINAGIMGGYNDRNGFPYTDTNGYHYGLGISPYTRIASTKIFNNIGGYFDISACNNNNISLLQNAYNNGATITSNSWGSDSAGAYDADSQAYDALSRDASAATAGNQEMLHIFAAGNAGPNTRTVGSPSTAKNVLAVGATENVRDQGVLDGCGAAASNNADNMASFSSRGPAADLRSKPDIVAPGIHIQGPASQDPGYDGTGVCGAANNKYYPPNQTLYTWSSGTSHSTPAVAGGASLVYNYYQRVLNPGQTPSPAMLKALILNTPRYLSGLNTGDTLPSPNQGWGDLDLGSIFDGTPRSLVDESYTFSATGQTYTRAGNILDPTKPLRVSLVWTDAPGSTTGAAYANDLNLEVSAGGQVYKGNVFSGGTSIIGGSFDYRNNVENVFLPTGISGNFSVKVTAANLVANAIPGSGSLTHQDFALVIYNADTTPIPVLSAASIVSSDVLGNGNGILEPGETISLNIGLLNSGTLAATNISTTLHSTGGVVIGNSTSPYPNILPGATITNTKPYTFTINPNLSYGTLLTFTLTASYSGGSVFNYNFTLRTGTLVLSAASVVSNDSLGNNNGTLEPGETILLNIGLLNSGNVTATGVSATLQAGSEVLIGNSTSAYPNIVPGATITNTNPYTFTISPKLTCGATLNFILTVSYNSGSVFNYNFTLQIGTPQSTSPSSYNATGLPLAIPDGPAPGIASTIPITLTGNVAKIKITLNISHLYDGDLSIELISPTGTRITLANRVGGSGDNFINTIFDDAASIVITGGVAPFTGSYRPPQPLSTFYGEQISGIWSLQVTDLTFGDVGTLNSWSMEVQPLPYSCSSTIPTSSITAVAGSNQSASIGLTFTTNLQALVTDALSQPVFSKTVQFIAPPSGASGTFPGGLLTATTTTNISGLASAPPFQANCLVGSYVVTATVSGLITPTTFALTNTTGINNIIPLSGFGQQAYVNTAFQTNLKALVRDSCNQPLSGVAVTFVAPTSGVGGNFTGIISNVVSVNTDPNGIALTPLFTANALTGSYTITATVDGYPNLSVGFNLTNLPSSYGDFVPSSFQVDVAHSGSISLTNFASTLQQRWAVGLDNTGGFVSYALAGQHKVFALSSTPDVGTGNRLWALDPATGITLWGPLTITNTHYWGALAYDNGRLFVLNDDNKLWAYNASDGSLAWNIDVVSGGYNYTYKAPPVAANGLVFILVGNTLRAYSATNGQLSWSQAVSGQTDYTLIGSSIMVDQEGVYVAGNCQKAAKFHLYDGSPVWTYDQGCSKSGQDAALHKGKLYLRSNSNPSGLILDASTGISLGNWLPSSLLPGFADKVAFVVNSSGGLEAWNTDTGTLLWQEQLQNGSFSVAPVVINQVAYVGANDGNLYAYDTSGNLLQQIATGVPNGLSDYRVVSGLGVGEDLLLIPSGKTLVALESISNTVSFASNPLPGSAIDLGTTRLATTLTSTIAISNTGAASLTISNPVFSGTNPNEFAISGATFPITLNGTTETNFKVNCTPAKGGTRTARLNLTTSDGLVPTVFYDLKCKGALIVTANTDNGAGDTPGTLSYYFTGQRATASQIITFALTLSQTIKVNGVLPPVPVGVGIDGGTICGSPPTIVIDGSGVIGDGLQLSVGNYLHNIWVKGFANKQINSLFISPWIKNRLLCVRTSR